MKRQEIFLCAINNVLSGRCGEDCKFCTQSIRYKTDIHPYDYKALDTILSEARKALAYGASGYCLVTAGRKLDSAKTEYIARTAHALRKEYPSLHLIACNGTADTQNLLYLKRHGIDSYNHNLETSERYYPEICTTHSWQERYATCEAVKISGLALCCGGILGMGESPQDREDFLTSLRSLCPDSIPLNFYVPHPALPLGERTVDRNVALAMIRKIRNVFGEELLLMAAGGRENLFSGAEEAMFSAGINAIVIGDYLTVRGEDPGSDRKKLEEMGYTVASCRHGK